MAGLKRSRHEEKESINPDFDSDYTEKGGLPMWLPDQLIRNKKTGDALLVIHVYRNATIVADPKDLGPLITNKILLERDYHYFSRDTEMRNKDPLEYEGDWYYKRCKI